MKMIQLFTLSLCLFILSGCAVSQAQDYLKHNETEKGITLTTKELKKDPNDAYMNYYYGRFLLNQRKNKEAIKHFKIAAESFPYKIYYKFWLGVAYGINKEYDKERDIYLSILDEKNGRYKNALVNLGKNYYLTKNYDKAIETFEKAHELYMKPHSYMYYYYAAALMQKNRISESLKYYLAYLNNYPNYSLAQSATYNINKYGDFSYSNFKIGDKILSIRAIEYLPRSNSLEYYSKESLKRIGMLINEDKDLTLYVITYEKDDLKKAEIRVKNIKKYLLTKFPEIKFSQIKIGWFKTSKKIKVDKQVYKLNSYTSFFTKK
jgi:tetratricopeptide (TPR) repeat protein